MDVNSITKKKILVVEDDDFFREAITSALADCGYSVISASNGKSARDMVVTFPVDLILSDVQMPHMSGLEFLNWLREEHSTPFILMTGFSSLLETKSAFDYGANDFLAKPFPIGTLIDKLDELLAPPKEEKNKSKDIGIDEKSLCRISIEDFISDQKLSIEIFLKLSDEKFVKISHGGGKLSPERISNYKEKGLHYLYVKKSDFKNIVKFNIKVANLAVKSAKIPKEKKERFIAHAGSVILEHAFQDKMDRESFDYASDFFKLSMDLISEEEQIVDLISQLDEGADHLYLHSIAVSFFSVAIAKKMGWTSPPTQFKLAVGGMLHDIGKKEIDKMILGKSRAQMSFDERRYYESHSLRGKEILESIPGIPNEVVSIVYEHHENNIGQGYPRKLKGGKIHPLAKVTSVADAYCALILPGPHHAPIESSRAIASLFDQRDLYHSPALRALAEIVPEE